MAKLFEDEKKYPDNAQRKNFVFLAYPFTPPLAQDDYRAVMKELQKELPIRLWYFLDEVTTQELMRKIWRAILRADLAVFDISRGNPNVAFELGMAVAVNRPCITLLKTDEPNPLGGADLSYSERSEYTSRETLKARVRQLLIAKSSGLRLLHDIAYRVQSDAFKLTIEQLEEKIIQLVNQVFHNKKTSKDAARKIFGDEKNATVVMNALRESSVLQVEGTKRGAKWVFASDWVYFDHEVVGV